MPLASAVRLPPLPHASSKGVLLAIKRTYPACHAIMRYASLPLPSAPLSLPYALTPLPYASSEGVLLAIKRTFESLKSGCRHRCSRV
jgi:hypothetical protein